MKINIILKENIRDEFELLDDYTFYLDSIFTNPETSKVKSKIVSHDIFKYLSGKRGYQINPQNTLVADFANIALTTYSIDQIAEREKYGVLGWSRYFNLHIPVYNLDKWNLVKNDLEQTLSFLSGDKWTVHFRKTTEAFPQLQDSEFKAKKVCLFSGGMDSFIGINDLIHKYDRIATISHHKSGNSGELSLQKKLIQEIKTANKSTLITPFYFYVQGLKNDHFKGEKTQRARSIIFLALGLLIANTSSDTTSVIIPENGLISLNLPLTPARGGSHSTKTTHPKYITGLNDIFKKIGINNRIENPYRFKTKGEMLTECENADFVREKIRKTLSCSKPGYHKQWTKVEDDGNNKDVSNQCGYCVPCIIRRASLYTNGLDKETDYFKGISDNQGDFRAFNYAISKYTTKQIVLSEFLKAGSMNLTSREIKKYVNMYIRGIKEVKKFIQA
ncbi:hypothetical protein J5U18_03490 [Sphingobacteriaceae bacterium WQ 2009]|uniref:ATPase n=1 Tax=Rhinopithecimicrobium faecis TaxID=2820698 RepID=A0A8T4H8D6_9SPHI|nr:hypothetical protein [Sphingobacteriaceae bacterium WQ 2009]